MWDLVFRSVVTQFVAFRLCEDAEKCRIAVRYPMTESKTANEHGDTGQNGVEEIEGAYRADADEVEQSALYAQVSERLMHALEDSICAMFLICVVWHRQLVQHRLNFASRASYTPQSQLRTFTAKTAIPVPAATPAKDFFAPGSPWAKP